MTIKKISSLISVVCNGFLLIVYVFFNVPLDKWYLALMLFLVVLISIKGLFEKDHDY